MIGGSRAGEDVTPDAAAEELPGDIDQLAVAGLLADAGLKDLLCLGPILAKSVYSYAGIPLGVALQFTRPLLAELLRGSTISLIIAGSFAGGGRLPLWAVLLAPIPYTMLTDPCYYWAGRRYGRPLVGYLEKHDRRWHRRARRAESFFARWGLWAILFAYYVPVPNDLLYFGAGDARIPFWRFLAVDFVGTLLYIGLWVTLGFVIGKPAENVADAVGQYSGRITIAVVVVIVLFSVLSAWRNTRRENSR
ncbi:MAG: VTT domain-containing protein [Candidatus Dormibacteraeota bacterium]|uniref:VTT domain-containing protein n=1 Tax=Candidatus Amunia macphersoniae TaxID=3127014 RepID=A0A934N9X5_9BACT|nr:VTT domain-containing protein [Candidatus Dormibacteraeota bacterium]